MSQIIPKKRITVCDVVIIISVVALTALSFILMTRPDSGSNAAHIITTEKDFYVDLDKDDEFDLESNGFSYTVKIADGSVSVTEADCPDGICVNTPAIGKRHGSIGCLPGKLIIECKETEGMPNDADVVVP